MPVYIKGRGGNSQTSFEQAATLRRMFTLLESNDVSIDTFRTDSASYQKDAIEVLEANAERFYIRARRSASMDRQIRQVPNGQWTSIQLGWQKMDVTEITWTPFGAATSYRLTVSRIKRADNQGDLFSGGTYSWRQS